MVSKVSIVGVDDSISPQDLVDISQSYQFVEWAVNLCPNPEQKQEYPSAEWLDELLQYEEYLRLRGILHGRWEKDILDGNNSIKFERPDLWSSFRWIQVDVRKEQRNIIASLQQNPDKIIIQTDTIPKFPAHILLPRNKIYTCNNYCGYSLLDGDVDWLCKDIKESFWVSVEGFRSDDNITMDLNKVCDFLNLAEDFVTHNSLLRSLQKV